MKAVLLLVSLLSLPAFAVEPLEIRKETNPRICVVKEIKISCAYLMAIYNQVKSESTVSTLNETRPGFRKDI